jgi:hypothetical protein
MSCDARHSCHLMNEVKLKLLPNESQSYEWTREGYVISTDRARIDLAYVHRFLSEQAYWSKGVSFDTIRAAVNGSLPFGLFAPSGAQVGES